MFTHPARWRHGLAALAAACGAALAPALPGAAQALSGAELLRVFADCTGRYAALTEHLWLTDGPASEGASALRDTFAELTEAAAPVPGGGSTGGALALRVEARAAQRTLLDTAAFHPDAARAAAARAAAEAALAGCDRLLAGL